MHKTKFLTLILIILFLSLLNSSLRRINAQTTTQVRITGLVNKPLNLTQNELFSLPMVSELINLECVFHYPNATLNWTGVPLFHLLTLAQVKPEAREVVFRASDGFSSSLTMEEALKPTIMLALKANGTILSEASQIFDIQGGIRIVVPCKWGYKWVANVEEIEVVDYDYKGTYESAGFSDEANIPDCTEPSINPPLQTYNLSFGARTFLIHVFTNASLSAFNFNYTQKEIRLSAIVPPNTTGFANFILPQSLLKGPYSVFLDDITTDITEANVSDRSFLNLLLPEGPHVVGIVGAEFFGSVPEIQVDYNQTVYVGETVIFDASESVDDGQIVSYNWDFGDSNYGNGSIVYHSYSAEGIYQATLNITDNDDLSQVATLTINVRNRPEPIPQVFKVFLAVISAVLIIMFTFMLFNRKTKKRNSIP